MVHKDNLAARFENTGTFGQHAFRIVDERDDKLSYNAIEILIFKPEIGCIHLQQLFDMGVLPVGRAFLRASNHWSGDVDSDDFGAATIVAERKACADSDFENAAAYFTRRMGGGPACIQEDWPADEIINRRPAGICLSHNVLIGVAAG